MIRKVTYIYVDYVIYKFNLLTHTTVTTVMVATRLRCGGIFNVHIVANFLKKCQ